MFNLLISPWDYLFCKNIAERITKNANLTFFYIMLTWNFFFNMRFKVIYFDNILPKNFYDIEIRIFFESQRPHPIIIYADY